MSLGVLQHGQSLTTLWRPSQHYETFRLEEAILWSTLRSTSIKIPALIIQTGMAFSVSDCATRMTTQSFLVNAHVGMMRSWTRWLTASEIQDLMHRTESSTLPDSFPSWVHWPSILTL